jgi:flagellar biosynthesis protein FlhF
MSTHTSDRANAPVRTYRGRTLEEVLPRVRAELGPNAIVLRQREGLMGGVAGFFQQRFVEIDVRAGGASIDVYDEDPEPALPPSEPNAGAELLRAIAALERSGADPASSFARALASAETTAPAPAPDPAASPPAVRAATPVASGSESESRAQDDAPAEELLSGKAVLDALERMVAADDAPAGAVPSATPAPRATAVPPAPAQTAPEPCAPAQRPERGRAARARRAAKAIDAPTRVVATDLHARGLSAALTGELLEHALTHELPFAGEDLAAAARRSLAQRLPSLPATSGAVAVAFVGPGGAGKSHCAAALAAAYGKARRMPVAAISLGAGRELATLLKGRRISVHTRGRHPRSAARLGRAREHGLTVIDTPPISVRDPEGIARLAGQLEELAPVRVVLALPATASARAADELVRAAAPLRPQAIVVTHVDETDGIGIALEAAILHGLPVAWTHEGRSVDGALRPADPAQLAERMLP